MTARAQFYRPTDPTALAAEAHRLRSGGLTVRDIGAALRLAPSAVANMLASQARPVAPTNPPTNPE
jgi:hypothetical protein